MPDCLFCKIASGQIPATIVHQDDDVVAFRDIKPEAPFHLLVIPRRHIATLNELTDADHSTVGALVACASRLAKEHGYAERGFRTVFNCNADAGQTIFHIHLHVLAGRGLAWPPG